MWCTRCGTQIPDSFSTCPRCGNVLTPPRPASSPSFGFQPAADLGEPSRPIGATPPPAYSAPRPMAPPVPPMAPPPRPMAPPVPPMTPPPRPVTPAAPAVSPSAPTAAPKASTAEKKASAGRRISAGRELKLLLRQGWLVMCGERRNLIISLLFPFIAAAIIIWIAGGNMFVTHEDSKSACFIIVCSAIWCGLFNSIQSVVKERENIKRDYVSGALRIECYTASRAILQLVLCFVQSGVLFLAIPGISLFYGNDLPKDGLLMGTPLVEYFITIFFILLASDTMGLMISSFVKKDELAGKLAPYILIAELLFSGTLFDMEGPATILSALMISRWGMEALGSISTLNTITPRGRMECEPDPSIGLNQQMIDTIIPNYDEAAYEATTGHLLLTWGIMVLFILVPLVACNFLLHNVKKDARS